MSQDNFNRINKSETFLKTGERPVSFALAPDEIAAIKAHRQTRKIKPTKKVVGMSRDETDPGFRYEEGKSFFDELVGDIKVVCGKGAFFDPESTKTMAVAIG